MKQKILLLLSTFLLFFTIAQAQQFPEIIKVKGSTYKMGDEQGIGEPDEQPVHSVSVKTFGIAKTETTVLQWKTYCNATGKQMPKVPKEGWINDYPMVNVSWEDALAYCKWLSKKTGKQYHLPTEAEWEFAARGGGKSKGFKYSGGNNIDSVSWYKDNGNNVTHAVAQNSANELELYDMTGNVWEWCEDWYVYVAYSPTKAKDIKIPPSTRIFRGGCATTPSIVCRITNRGSSEPTYRDPFIGFRVAVQM